MSHCDARTLRSILVGFTILTILGCEGPNPFPEPDPYVNPEPSGGSRPTLPPPSRLPPAPPPPAPTPPGTTTDQPIVPLGSTPPVGITLHIGVAENVSKSKLSQVYASFVGVNSTIWNVTEGQVYIYKMVISDNVAAGTTPSAWEANMWLFPTNELDIVVWPVSSWDLAGIGGKVWFASALVLGRAGRLMLIPDNASGHTLQHELSHLMWDLSWTPSYSLADEYADGVQDASCLMESNRTPIRWCAASNHVSQSSIPRSCWEQIRLDYPTFWHFATERATSAPWVPEVTYEDTP